MDTLLVTDGRVVEGNQGRLALDGNPPLELELGHPFRTREDKDCVRVRLRSGSTPLHELYFKGPEAGASAWKAFVEIRDRLPGAKLDVTGLVIHNGGSTALQAWRLNEATGGMVLLQAPGNVEPIRSTDVLRLEERRRVLLNGALFHEEPEAGPLPKAVLLGVLRYSGARLEVPGELTPAELREMAKAGRLDEGLARMESELSFDASTYGATPVGKLGETRAWKLPAEFEGRVLLQARELHAVGPGDELVAEYGGISAAIGIVPMGITLKRKDGASRWIYNDSVDEHTTEIDSKDVYREMVAFFGDVARAAGCRFRE